MTARAKHELHAELLAGRTVRDRQGRTIGRIAELVVTKDGDEFVVSHYLVRPRAWMHRVAVHGLGLRLRGLAWVYRVDWSQMDLDNPDRPTVTCDREALPVEHLPPRKRGVRRRPARPVS